MKPTGTPRISIAIMHHPARESRVDALIKACRPLSADVVVDPDPTGSPSPLRTAKKAWAAIAPDATHHMVLQDDVEPINDFGDHLFRAVTHCRDRAIALYLNWHSTPNAYFLRRAVQARSAFAPLSTAFIPTQGLLLPAVVAADLARYLATIPDEYRHDDRAIATYCTERAVPVVTTVPNLLDHVRVPSLAGNEIDGDRRSAVFDPDLPLPEEHWAAGQGLLPALERRASLRSARDFSVQIHNSQCRIRFARPGSGEHIWHPYGWYWRDWAPLLGVDERQVLAGLRAYQRGRRYDLPLRIAEEVWAAGFILGLDAVAGAPANPAGRMPGGTWPTLLRLAVLSWIDSGLASEDKGLLAGPAREQMGDISVAAVARGTRWIRRAGGRA